MEFVLCIALLSLAVGLRACQPRGFKKLGALFFLLAMGALGWAIWGHWAGCLGSVVVWFFIPLVEVLWKYYKKSYSIEPRLMFAPSEDLTNFCPNAASYMDQVEDLGFESIHNQSWQCLDRSQHHQFYWHPELYTVVSVCLCELESIAFSYITLHSCFREGTSIQTTNYPFTTTLLTPPSQFCKHLPCEDHSLSNMLKSHLMHVSRHNTNPCQLKVPDPEKVEEVWTNLHVDQVLFNLKYGLITEIGDGTFTYTFMGYMFLWSQSIKDLIRLC